MKITIIGSGKTGRGLIARKLCCKGYDIVFIDINPELINQLNLEKEYRISFFGGKRKPVEIQNYTACLSYSCEAEKSLQDSELIFVSVGAKNLADVGKQIALALSEETTKKTIVTCENAIDPALKLQKHIEENGCKLDYLDVAEAGIFCSTIEFKKNSIDIVSEDMDYVPFSSSLVSKDSISLSILDSCDNFKDLLERKIYTYNSSSALIAYLGWYCGYSQYADAANDADIVYLLDRLYSEINVAIERKYKVSSSVQEQFSAMAKGKFQNKEIKDTIERNAREADRKLANDERIIGPMLLLLQTHNFSPSLALTAAAAILYGKHSDSTFSSVLAEKGVEGLLCTYSSLQPDSDLIEQIKYYYDKISNQESLSKIVNELKQVRVLIFGAGKIARGFIGHMLFKGGIKFRFIDYNRDVVDLLNKQRCYTVRILDEEIKEDVVSDVSAYSYDDKNSIIDEIAQSTDDVFISVGGKNLPSLNEILTQSLQARMIKNNLEPMNIILCENWIKPADIVKELLYENASKEFKEFLDRYIGITESVIMRSGIEPTKECLEKDPLAVNVQDFWYYPVDAKRIKRPLPAIPGLHYLDDFSGYLDRKFYTYNAANATVSYMGYLKKYTYISDAAHDPEIIAQLEKVYEETGKALCIKHGFDYSEQYKFSRTSLSKVQNKYIVDYIERNARDPIRKLGPYDRLVGPARLVVQYGGHPDALCTSIAAAIYYDQSSDPIAQNLKEIRETLGVDYILSNICKLSPSEDSEIWELVHKKIDSLKKRGLIA